MSSQVNMPKGKTNEVAAVVADVAPQLEEEQRRQLESLLKKYKEVHVKELEDREAVKGVEHEIELEPGTKPICIPVRHFFAKRDGGIDETGEATQTTAHGVLVLCWCPRRMGQRE